MLQFLHSEHIWREFKTLSRERNRRLSVAVPYIGQGGGKLLRLKPGDVLAVALTPENSRNGSVCPMELARLQRNGVKVCVAPNLHAKVVLCGRKVVVSSANLSRHSEDYLDEAGLLTTDAAVVKEVREWFSERTAQEAPPQFLDECAKIYRPPKRGGTQNRNAMRRRLGRAVWLIGVHDIDLPEDEVAFEQQGASQARRELSDPRRFEVRSVRWTGKSRFPRQIRKGDTVIQIDRRGASRYVIEAAVFLRMRKTKSRRGVSVTYIYLACVHRRKEKTWRAFKQYCTSIGLNLPRGVDAREIMDWRKAAKAIAFLSRK
jgi:hypothetical protein